MSFVNGVDEKSKSFMIGGYTLCEKNDFYMLIISCL